VTRDPVRTLAQVEAELGRPCPHERVKPDYCRLCSKSAYYKRAPTLARRGLPPSTRRTLAQVEAELGRPCPHERFINPDYCRLCSNSVSQKRATALARRGLEQYYTPVPRRTLAQMEAELGRPCTHERTQPDYCRACTMQVSHRRYMLRKRNGA
jgi:hypothetical protein